jgi:hypothetical protein
VSKKKILKNQIMRRILKINVSKSIKDRRLIFSESRYEKLDQFFTYITFLFGIYILVSIYFVEKQPLNEFLKYSIPLIILFLIYCIYRKIIEKKLIEINTDFDKETNTIILLNFAKNKNYEVFRESKEILIFNESGYLLSKTISSIFLVCDNKIYFTILKQGFRMDPPTLFSHITIKKELKNYFENNKIENRASI